MPLILLEVYIELEDAVGILLVSTDYALESFSLLYFREEVDLICVIVEFLCLWYGDVDVFLGDRQLMQF